MIFESLACIVQSLCIKHLIHVILTKNEVLKLCLNCFSYS